MANICKNLEMKPLIDAKNLEEIRREENYDMGGYKMANSIEDMIICMQDKGKSTGKEDEITECVDQLNNQQLNSEEKDKRSNKQGKSIDRQYKKIEEQSKCVSKQEQIVKGDNTQGEVIYDNNSVAVVLDENADDIQNGTLEFAPSTVPTNKQQVVSWTTWQLRKACKWILRFIFVTLLYYLQDYLFAMMEERNNSSDDNFNRTTIASFNDDTI